jgi:hypothetical protein
MSVPEAKLEEQGRGTSVGNGSGNVQNLLDRVCGMNLNGNEDISEFEDEPSDLPLPKPYFERVQTGPTSLLAQSMLSRGRSQSPRKGQDVPDMKSRLKSANMTRSMPNFNTSGHRSEHNKHLGKLLLSVECQRSQSDSQPTAKSRVDEFSRLLGDL